MEEFIERVRVGQKIGGLPRFTGYPLLKVNSVFKEAFPNVAQLQ